MNYLYQLINAGIEKSEAIKEISILEKEGKDLDKITEIVNERIKTRRPLQYILKKAYFMDFEVIVNENVLIPRPETELLAEETIHRCTDVARNVSILDIGTGSGIISIALAKALPNAKITAIDLNKEIIKLAKNNAIKNNVNEKINFKICDVFSKCFEGLINANKFDLIISNPPYVKEDIFKTLTPEVNLHEPKIALTGSVENKSGLIYYERIIDCFPLTPMAFEIDPSLTNGLTDLMQKHKMKNYEIIKDYSKLDRFLFINF